MPIVILFAVVAFTGLWLYFKKIECELQTKLYMRLELLEIKDQLKRAMSSRKVHELVNKLSENPKNVEKYINRDKSSLLNMLCDLSVFKRIISEAFDHSEINDVDAALLARYIEFVPEVIVLKHKLLTRELNFMH